MAGKSEGSSSRIFIGWVSSLMRVDGPAKLFRQGNVDASRYGVTLRSRLAIWLVDEGRLVGHL